MAKGRTVDRAKFFDAVRHSVFPHRMTQKQVDGMNAILEAWDNSVFTDLRWLAYMFGTTFHETGGEMQPIAERGGYDYCERNYGPNGRRPDTARRMGNVHAGDGYKYRGRGDVQMTWHNNYERASEITGVDLVNNPDLAMMPDIAAQIMFAGMTDARVIFEDFNDDKNFSFTGRTLEDYFNDNTEDWYNARRIINGTDHAQMIAETAQDFFAALAYN
jgi:putative chitinase